MGPLHSFLIEQVLGFYLLITAIIMAARADYYRIVIREFVANKVSIMVSASFTLILGLIMVVVHNIWIVRFDLLVTIISWLIVIKAILWLSFPECMASFIQRFTKTGLYVTAVIQAIIGIFLLTKTYHVFGYHYYIWS